MTPMARRRDESQEFLRAAGLRLKAARKAEGLTQIELGQRLGVTQSVVSDWERGGLASWQENLAALQRHLRTDLSDLALTPLLTTASSPAQSIVVIGEVQGGAFRRALEYPPEERYQVPVTHGITGYEGVPKWALKVIGPSVNLLYPEGTFVIVVRADDTEVCDGDRVVVYDRRGEFREATVKELRVEAGGRIALWPRSSHPDFQDPIYLDPGDEMNQDGPEIAYVVIGSFRPEDRPARSVAWKKL